MQAHQGESMKTYTHYDGDTGCLTLKLTQEDVDSVPQSGAADEEIAALRKIPRIEDQLQAAKMYQVREHLGGYGAWSRDELMDDEASRDRWLWLAICDIHENPEDYSDGE